MIHIKIIQRILGVLLLIESGILLLCSFFPLFYGEEDLPEDVYERFAGLFRWAVAALQVVNEDKQKVISLSIWAGAASTICNVDMNDFNTYIVAYTTLKTSSTNRSS